MTMIFLAVEEDAGGDGTEHHFFKAECLSAKLDFIGMVFLGLAVFVFNGDGIERMP